MSRLVNSLLAFTALACTAPLVFAEDPADSAKLFTQLDTNSDGAVAEDEVPKEKQTLFHRLMRTADKNGDGRLSREEFVEGLKAKAKPDTADEDQRTADKNSADKNSADKSADGKGKLGKRRLAGGDGQDLAALIGRLDKNGDGRVTADEVPEDRRDRFQSLLKRLDSNGDGALSKDELPKAQPKNEQGDGKQKEAGTGGAKAKGRPGKGGGGRNINQLRQRLKEADKNGDGKLSKEEMPERLAPLFKRLDKDNDGQVDATELRSGLEQMRAQQEKQSLKKNVSKKQKLQAKMATRRGKPNVQSSDGATGFKNLAGDA